ncbi:MAG: hypothetical protein K8S54_13090 [Spirochaetia bacterium]|nr:hypothetical protein [Spirochaetia bacterium]
MEFGKVQTERNTDGPPGHQGIAVRRTGIGVLSVFLMISACVSDRQICSWEKDDPEFNRGAEATILVAYASCVAQGEPARRCDSLLPLALLFEMNARACEGESDIPLYPKVVLLVSQKWTAIRFLATG